jgi:RNA polymerase-associated protein RTF1
MEESDSDDDEGVSFADEVDRYPLEGKFINAADKAEIMAMSEIKREEILADRAQEVERDKQSRALKQLLAARGATEKKAAKKRKAEELEDSQRKTSRQRTKLGGGKVGESSSGIDSLKRARAEKDDRQRRRQEDRERNVDRKDRDFDDYQDDQEESEVEWDDRKRSESPPAKSLPAEYEDFLRCKVGRREFAEYCFYPGFEEAFTGLYVRIAIGADKRTGQMTYRMALIKGKQAQQHTPP